MATSLEIRVMQKLYLSTLLEIKDASKDNPLDVVQKAIDKAVVMMEAEDVSYVEKVTKVKAL